MKPGGALRRLRSNFSVCCFSGKPDAQDSGLEAKCVLLAWEGVLLVWEGGPVPSRIASRMPRNSGSRLKTQLAMPMHMRNCGRRGRASGGVRCQLCGRSTSGLLLARSPAASSLTSALVCPAPPHPSFSSLLPPSLPPGASTPARAHTQQPASIGFPPFLSERRRKPPPAFQHARCSCTTREHRASASFASHNSALVSPDLHPPRPPSLLPPLPPVSPAQASPLVRICTTSCLRSRS